MNMFVTCKLISYMHRALIFGCAGREVVGSAVAMILQPLCVLHCLLLLLFVTLFISMHLPSFMNIDQ